MPNSAQAKMRYPHWFRYVPHDEVESYKERGWEWTSSLVDTRHGEHSVLMIWPYNSEPPNEEDRQNHDY